MNSRNADWPEYVAAAVVVAFGLWLAGTAAMYPLGSLLRPGPGYFPLLVGCVVVALGVAVALEARGKPLVSRHFALRPCVAVIAGIAAFALLVGTAGFVPAAIALVILSGFGERRREWLSLLGVAAFVAFFGAVLFIWGLGVPLHAFGSSQ